MFDGAIAQARDVALIAKTPCLMRSTQVGFGQRSEKKIDAMRYETRHTLTKETTIRPLYIA